MGAQGVRGWFYTVGTPAAGIAPAVIDAVYPGGAGKYASQPTKRRDDSNDHMMLWFEHGPDAAATKKSVQMVNKYHAHLPGRIPTASPTPRTTSTFSA